MHLHLIPYEQVFLSITVSLDEATAISDALATVTGGLSEPALALKKLLDDGIEKASKLQDRRVK
jgi:hypothetical protein